MASYKLMPNNGEFIEFSEHQLELMEYAKSALKNIYTDTWIATIDNILPVPGLSREMLEYVHRWSLLASSVSAERRRLRRPSNSEESPIITDSTTWTEKSTGFANELLVWADKCFKELSVDDFFRLLDAACFVGAEHMIELLAFRISLEIVHLRNKVFLEFWFDYYMKDPCIPNPLNNMSSSEELEFVQKWVDSDEPTMSKILCIKSFLREVEANFKRHFVIKNIILQYQ